MLHSILHCVSIGFNSPHTPYSAHNLSSAFQHPEVISSKLENKVTTGWVPGPFTERLLPNLRTSELGAALKKNDKWRVIPHLSALYGSSINDGISKEDSILARAT